MASREAGMLSPAWAGRERELLPLMDLTASDSANLDRVAEYMVASGKSAEEVQYGGAWQLFFSCTLKIKMCMSDHLTYLSEVEAEEEMRW